MLDLDPKHTGVIVLFGIEYHAPVLTKVRSARSGMGSGTLAVVTYSDPEGNEWTAVGGSRPVLTATAERLAELAAARAAGAALREALMLQADPSRSSAKWQADGQPAGE